MKNADLGHQALGGEGVRAVAIPLPLNPKHTPISCADSRSK